MYKSLIINLIFCCLNLTYFSLKQVTLVDSRLTVYDEFCVCQNNWYYWLSDIRDILQYILATFEETVLIISKLWFGIELSELMKLFIIYISIRNNLLLWWRWNDYFVRNCYLLASRVFSVQHCPASPELITSAETVD